MYLWNRRSNNRTHTAKMSSIPTSQTTDMVRRIITPEAVWEERRTREDSWLHSAGWFICVIKRTRRNNLKLLRSKYLVKSTPLSGQDDRYSCLRRDFYVTKTTITLEITEKRIECKSWITLVMSLSIELSISYHNINGFV